MPRPCDDRLMWEAHQKSKEELIDEGLWDRAKAKAAGFKAGAKQVGKNIGAGAKAVTQLASGEGEKAVQTAQSVAKPGGAKASAQASSLAKSHVAKIQKAVQRFQADMDKLGLTQEKIAEVSPEAGQAIQNILSGLQTINVVIDKGYLAQAPSAAPAATPAPTA